jgi:hypothetical protein
VTARTSQASVAADAVPIAAVAPAPPVNVRQPSVSVAKGVWYANAGAWSGTARITYTYRWQRCVPKSSSCTNISGAMSARYVPTKADGKYALRVVVTASNAGGSVSASSAPLRK